MTVLTYKLLALLNVILLSMAYFIQDPPQPQPPGPPPPPGLPIDGGVIIGLLFGLVFGVSRLVKAGKKD
ncbi:hypothetical protein ACFSQP_06545 [Bizionia sediminis]|uniref:XapX domain-containing protein n=1 Tax=Bizionia sediminis TaxID=1737064 RepID=A0ABW5KR30_9FLAO